MNEAYSPWNFATIIQFRILIYLCRPTVAKTMGDLWEYTLLFLLYQTGTWFWSRGSYLVAIKEGRRHYRCLGSLSSQSDALLCLFLTTEKEATQIFLFCIFLWSVKGYMYGIRSLQMFCLLRGIYHVLRLLSCHMKHCFLIFPVIWYPIIQLSWGSAISGGTSLSSWWNTPSSKVGCKHHLLCHLWVRPELSCKWFLIVLLVPSVCAFPSRLDRLIFKATYTAVSSF